MNKQYLIVGGGVVGLSLARSLVRASVPAQNIRIFEKENYVGAHTSGRNSGVLHAGFYYATDSQKARYCKLGNQFWTEFCKTKNIPIKQCGKLVVCKTESEIPYFQKLYQQGLKNQVDIRLISMDEARAMEPTVVGFGTQAIYSPTTSVMDTKAALKVLKNDLLEQGVNINLNEQFKASKSTLTQKFVETDKNIYQYDYMINAAGLDSLEIAQGMGQALDLRMVPFKGRYAISKQPMHINMLVYPVPEQGAYVLGVHSTLTPDGYVKIGPTVFPAFGKENYDMLQGVTPSSFLQTSSDYLKLLRSKKERGLIWQFLTKELIKSVSISKLTRDVNKIQNMQGAEFEWYRAGIRPQLYCSKERKLINDFVWYNTKDSLHLLNVVSPGWTCAMPFADAVVSDIVLKV